MLFLACSERVTPDHYPCPSCGFLVFDEPPGSYGICELCGWEDDHVQLAHPTLQGGANKKSLVEHQRTAIARWPLETKNVGDFERDPRWRPFEPGDAHEAETPSTGLQYFRAALENSPDYYWRR